VSADVDFRPERILRILNKHKVRYVVIGGLAAIIHGSDIPTTDVDITPEDTMDNLERLSRALREMNARVWTQPVPEGLPFDHDAASLADVQILNLVTDFGRFDVTRTPAGTRGYDDLHRDAVTVHIYNLDVPVASLADVVRSKEAAGREKDLRFLPQLRRLLEEGPPEA
jgi:predicted nucleotidyltransferase